MDTGLRRHGVRGAGLGFLPYLAVGALICFAVVSTICGPASASSFAPIYQFQGGNDGSGPGGLTLGPGGELYGMTGGGGPCIGCGVVFKLTPPKRPGGTWTETTIYTFQGGNDGSFSSGNLIWGEDGALYGTTIWGGGSGCGDLGATGCGTVFKLTPPHGADSQWTETVLYRFQGGNDGAQPNGVTLGDDGALYGSTMWGGNPSCFLAYIPFPVPPDNSTSCGTVFKLAPPIWPHGMWTESIVHTFEGGTDGGTPLGPLTNRAGALYGVTQAEFFPLDSSTTLACGTIFKLRPPKPPWVIRIVRGVQLLHPQLRQRNADIGRYRPGERYLR